MTTTANRALTLVPSNSLQPSVPLNEALNALDAAVYGTTSIEFTSDTNLVLTQAQCDSSVLIFTDSPTTLTAGRDVVLPAHFPIVFILNSTAQTITVKKSGQSGATLTAGSSAIFVSGTTDVIKFVGGATFTGGALTSALNEAKGSDIASATTTDIGAATGNFVHVTGTTSITGLGTVQAGTRRIVRFAASLTLTHNATSLILPTGANITTAANDCAMFISEGSGNWRCVAYQKADGTSLASGGGGSLTGFTSSLETATPNSTTNVSRMLASGGTTNQDLALEPKGTGANVAQLPDATTTGGDRRGSRATDWQKSRSSSSQVASGANSTISGGINNTASSSTTAIGGGTGNTANGTSCTIAGGASNTSSGTAGTVGGGNGNQAIGASYSTVAGGGSNTASGDQSAVGGGGSNTASGAQAAIPGGLSNTANGDYSWIPGGFYGNSRSIYGVGSRASGRFSASGDCQDQVAVLRASTTDATQTTLTTDGSSASTSNQLVLPNNSSYVVKAIATARQNTTGDSKSWDVTVHIKRGANAAATAVVAAATVTTIANDSGASAWALAVDADTTNGCLRIRGTGEASKSIKWGFDVYSCMQVVG